MLVAGEEIASIHEVFTTTCQSLAIAIAPPATCAVISYQSSSRIRWHMQWRLFICAGWNVSPTHESDFSNIWIHITLEFYWRNVDAYFRWDVLATRQLPDNKVSNPLLRDVIYRNVDWIVRRRCSRESSRICTLLYVSAFCMLVVQENIVSNKIVFGWNCWVVGLRHYSEFLLQLPHHRWIWRKVEASTKPHWTIFWKSL